MATYFYPPLVDVGKAQTLVSGYGGIFLPSFTQDTAYTFDGTALAAVSGTFPTYGATASTVTSAGTWWTTWENQVAQIDAAGTISEFATASANVFLNGAAQNSNTPYFSSFNGTIYTISGNSMVASGAIASGSVGLVEESGILYSLIAPANEIAEYDLATGVISYSAAPISNLLQVINLTPTASGVAVVGTAQGPLTDYGAYNVSTAPDASFSVFANPQNNTLYLLEGPDPNWSVINSYVASGTAYWCAWNELSTQVLVTDTASTNLVIYAVANSALSVFQTLTLTVSGATQIQGVPNAPQAVFVNPTQNTVQFLDFASGAWSEGQSLSITNPTCMHAVSATSIVVGANNSVAFLTYSSNTWSIASTTTLSFTPTSVYQDVNGVTYAVGTSGSTGYLTAIEASTVSTNWTGSGDAVYWQQGQILVSDISNKLLRSFFYATTLSTESTVSVPVGWKHINSGGIALFGATANNLYTYSFTKPFTVAPIPYGWVSVYNGSWGAVANLIDAFGIPMALTLNPANGYVTVVTTNNQLYEVNGSTLVSQSTITNYQNLTYNEPIGISDLLWYSDGHLYASTSLNSALLKVA